MLRTTQLKNFHLGGTSKPVTGISESEGYFLKATQTPVLQCCELRSANSHTEARLEVSFDVLGLSLAQWKQLAWGCSQVAVRLMASAVFPAGDVHIPLQQPLPSEMQATMHLNNYTLYYMDFSQASNVWGFFSFFSLSVFFFFPMFFALLQTYLDVKFGRMPFSRKEF